MTKSTRNLMVLVGAVTILSIVLFAVGPVLAQSGSSGSGSNGQGQGSNKVVVSTGETLGALVTRYNLSGNNLRDFLSLNSDLPLVPGQRVTFPAGLQVSIPTTGQNNSSSSSSSTTAATATTAAPAATSTTAAPAATSTTAAPAATSTTAAPAATSTTAAPAATSTTMATATTAAAGGAAATGTASPAATTSSAGSSTATTMPTTAATVAATTAPTTAATMAATGTATSSASGTVGGASSTSTPSSASSSSSSTAGGPNDTQLAQFVRLNSGLRFGLVVSLPAGIPATGANNQGTGVSGNNQVPVTGSGVNGISGMSGAAASNAACSTNPPKGFGFYKVRSGDSLQSISTRFGVSVETILSLNRGSAFAKGNIILLPSVEAPGQWDVKNICPSSSVPSR